MRQIKSNARVTNEGITLIVRIANEKLTVTDIEEVFGKKKADMWFDGKIFFVLLWQYATEAEQDHLLEIMNGYIENQPIYASRGEQL